MGSNREREMVNTFNDAGWAAVRLGGSGSGTTNNLPDVLASNGVLTLAIEEKYRTAANDRPNCYIKAEKAMEVQEFATRFGARAVAAMRYSTEFDAVDTADWFIAPLADAPTTGSGNLKLHHSIVQDWDTLSDLLTSDD